MHTPLAVLLTFGALSAPGGGAPIATELAGRSLDAYPFFEFVRAFNEGSPLEIAVDPGVHPGLIGQAADLYVVASKSVAGWSADPTLTDLTGSVESVAFVAGSIQANTFVVDGGTLSGGAGIELGVPYDVVVDVDRNGMLGAGDLIDGLHPSVAGAYVVHDVTAPGPLAVSEILYTGGTFLGQDTFYPSDVAAMGELPVVFMSHGNGQSFQWYDHIGAHLASYGYVFVSHQTNGGPGPQFAATSTLSNVDWFLNNLPSIAGGVLDGHVDMDRIVWIGQGRGAEGVVIAYDRLHDGTFTPSAPYTVDDVQLLAAIAPTDFQGPGQTDPHDANFSLWTGGAGDPFSNCASCDICQTFQLHDRAEGYRQSISLYGVSDSDFHAGGLDSGGGGPCLVGTADTHTIMRGYLLPLLERYVDGNVPARDFLTRQWEAFRPIGAPAANPCVVVDLMYREGAAPGKIVLDDFQSNPSATVASSGLPVLFDVSALTEGDLDDANATFTHDLGDPMNGMTLNGDGADDSAGVVFEWNGSDVYYGWLAPVPVPLDLWDHISFRACQATRHDPLTIGDLGDLTFSVTLIDENLNVSSIGIGAFGGGVEEPYQKTGCGLGVGWNNEFETIRVPIDGFRHDGSGIDLSRIIAAGFRFGPSFGSPFGRIGLDDIELLVD